MSDEHLGKQRIALLKRGKCIHDDCVSEGSDLRHLSGNT
jgi:hypothetical protein